MHGDIDAASGPWRSEGEWWHKAWAREEWDIAVSHTLLRIYRAKSRWYAEGIYD
jgi:hypothetical protein